MRITGYGGYYRPAYFEEEQTILYVFHDEDDGMWQSLCGGLHDPEDGRIVSLKEIFIRDETVGKLLDMPCGCFAER